MNDAAESEALRFDRPTDALIERLVEAATRCARIALRVRAFRPAQRADRAAAPAVLTLELDGVEQLYAVAARSRIRSREEIAALAASSRAAPLPMLVAAPHLTHAMADECVAHDLQFIDLAGNLHLHVPGRYLLVTGRPATPDIRRLASRAGKPAMSASASALRMIFVLLAAPELLSRPYREIAAAAQVALGTVGGVFDDLRERGLLAGTDDRRLLDPAALGDEWAINYPLRLLPKLGAQRFAADDPAWWQRAELPAAHAWWSGEVAAAKLTGQLRPAAQTLYVEPAARAATMMELVKRHRLRADPAGALEIVDAFWHLDAVRMAEVTAPPLLVYADLQRTRDPRNAEAAALIRHGLAQRE